MNSSKPENMKEEVWNQHLSWLDLVGSECKANQLKREREKRKDESQVPDPNAIRRPSA